MFATCCLLALVCQDPQGGDGPPEPEPVRELSRSEARTAAKAINDVLRDRKASMRERMEAIEAVANKRHEHLVKPLARVVLAGRSTTVRKKAAAALAVQPPEKANRAILVLLRNDKVQETPEVTASLVLALKDAGYHEKQWPEIEDLFEERYGADRVELQKALLTLITEHEEKQAVDLLLRNMDEPRPVNVDDPTNPPAEYWERRWKAWQVWRGQVKDALFAITGQRFSSSKEARNWLEKNGRKIGIR